MLKNIQSRCVAMIKCNYTQVNEDMQTHNYNNEYGIACLLQQASILCTFKPYVQTGILCDKHRMYIYVYISDILYIHRICMIVPYI